MTTIKELKLGQQRFTGWRMLLLPRDKQGVEIWEGKPVVGQVTSRFLQSFDLELNLAQNQVNLFEQTRCGGGSVYWGREYTAVSLFSDPTGLLKFSMELDNHAVETSLNTHSRYSVIYSEVTRKYFGFDEASPGIEKETSPKGDEFDSYRAMSLTAKGLQANNEKIKLKLERICGAIRNASSLGAIMCGDSYNFTPFSIGTDLLKKLRVYIAPKERRIYFTRVEPAAPPDVPRAARP